MTASQSINPASVGPAHGRWLRAGVLLFVLLLLAAGAAYVWHESTAGPKSDREAQEAAQREAGEVQKLKSSVLAFLGADELADAEPLLAQWCELRPAEAEPFRLRMYLRHRSSYQGKTESERQRLQELALDDGLKALDLASDDDATGQEVIFLALSVGRFDDAERVCSCGRARKPGDPYLMYLQARIAHARGNNRDAQTLLDAFLNKQPQFARGQLLRAVLYHEADEPEKAIPLLRRVIGQDRGLQQEAKYQLSLSLARVGQTQEAQQLITELQRQNLDQFTARSGHSDLPAVQVRRAELLLGAGKSDEALALLQNVVRDDATNAAARRLLATYYEQRGDAKKAAEHRRLVKE